MSFLRKYYEHDKRNLSLIELLIKKWYVEQYEEEQLYAELHEIAKDKDSAKKS